MQILAVLALVLGVALVAGRLSRGRNAPARVRSPAEARAGEGEAVFRVSATRTPYRDEMLGAIGRALSSAGTCAITVNR